MDFRKRIKEVCQQKGITQKDLANKLGITDISLNKTLRGEYPQLQTLERIAAALNVPLPDLFTQPKENTVNCPYCGGRIKLSRDGAGTTPTPPAKVPQQPAEKDEEPAAPDPIP
jgi:transcriptional regulator with XRE-family HTH domain